MNKVLCNVISGPWNLNRGQWNVNRGPWNVNRELGMWIGERVI